VAEFERPEAGGEQSRARGAGGDRQNDRRKDGRRSNAGDRKPPRAAGNARDPRVGGRDKPRPRDQGTREPWRNDRRGPRDDSNRRDTPKRDFTSRGSGKGGGSSRPYDRDNPRGNGRPPFDRDKHRDKPSGGRSFDRDKPSGARSFGRDDSRGAKRPHDRDKPVGGRSYDRDNSRGTGRPYDRDKPAGGRSYDRDKPSGGRSFDRDKPSGGRSFDRDKPSGARSYDRDKPAGGRRYDRDKPAVRRDARDGRDDRPVRRDGPRDAQRTGRPKFERRDAPRDDRGDSRRGDRPAPRRDSSHDSSRGGYQPKQAPAPQPAAEDNIEATATEAPPAEETAVEPRLSNGLVMPEGAEFSKLDYEARQELRSLPKAQAEDVGQHLVAAGMLIDEDPELALLHARIARGKASRVAIVREAAGLAAYHAGEWAEALSDLRAVRRMNGSNAHVAVMADCERALGRPERALDLAKEVTGDLHPATAVELRIVAAGARRDLGQLDAAVVALQGPDLDPKRRDSWSARLFYAYADNLEAAGRTDEAVRWFLNAAQADDDEETDAADRVVELGAAPQ
jgi:hypothetical protein